MDGKSEKQASPEEKLLKVIQKGASSDTRQRKDSGAVAQPSAAPATTVTAAVPKKAGDQAASMKGKAGLKLAKSPKGPEATAEKPGKKGKSEKRIVQSPVSVTMPKSAFRFTLLSVNRILGSFAALFLLLALWQVVTALQSVGATEGRAAVSPPEEVSLIAPSVSDGATNGLVGVNVFPLPPDTGKIEPITPRDDSMVSLKLMGFSGAEAILFDKKQEKMLILEVGQKFTLGEREFFVGEIGKDQVVVSDGRQKFIVK